MGLLGCFLCFLFVCVCWGFVGVCADGCVFVLVGGGVVVGCGCGFWVLFCGVVCPLVALCF